MTKAEELIEVEAELAKLQKEYDGFSKALPSTISSWVSDRGRSAPRTLNAIEAAIVKRMEKLEPKLDDLEAQRDELLAEVVCGIANVPSDSDINDPEILLRASAVSFSRLHKAGQSTPESQAMLKALVFYLRSLIEDEDPDDDTES